MKAEQSEMALKEKQKAQGDIEGVRKALERAENESDALKNEISGLEKKLAEDRNLAAKNFGEERRQLKQLKAAERSWLQQKTGAAP